MTQAKVELVQHSPDWSSMFRQEKYFLLEKIGNWLKGSIEHVGSTAVPGLMAKPVIDIMFGVESLEASKPAIEILKNNGYCYFPYKEEVMHWFCKPSNSLRTHHLHLIPFESSLWKERIHFRDALISDQALAEEYEALKLTLAKEHVDNREAYTDLKWPFIENVLKTSCADNK